LWLINKKSKLISVQLTEYHKKEYENVLKVIKKEPSTHRNLEKDEQQEKKLSFRSMTIEESVMSKSIPTELNQYIKITL
jgi:hypothetical protein